VVGVEGVERNVGGNDERVSRGMVAGKRAAFNQEEKLGTVRMFLSNPNQATNSINICQRAGTSFFRPFCFEVYTMALIIPPCQPGTKDGVAQLSR